MATLTRRKIFANGTPSTKGLTASPSSANSGGDEFINSGVEFLRVYNGHSGAQTITITANGTTTVKHPTFGTLNKDSITTYSLAATTAYYFGPFHPAAWNDANGKVQITYSGVTSMTVEVLYLDRQ